MMRSVRYLQMTLLLMVASTLSAALAQEEGFTITGTITNWPGGEAEVRAENSNPQSPSLREEIATATIAEDGSFEITLPPVTNTLMRSRLASFLINCEGITITPEDTRVTLGNLVVYRNGEAIADLTWEQVEEGVWFQPVGNEFINLWYYSNDAIIQANCEEVDGTIMDIEVAQGWNAVVRTVTEIRWPEEPHYIEVASVGGGEDVPWVMWFRGRIGARLEPNEENSAVVAEVMFGSPAQQAGLLPGDVIVALDGQDVRGKNPIDLIRGESGTTLTVRVMREGEPIAFEITRGSP